MMMVILYSRLAEAKVGFNEQKLKASEITFAP